MFNSVSTVTTALGHWESLQIPNNNNWSFGGIYFLLGHSEVVVLGFNKFQAELLSFSSVFHVAIPVWGPWCVSSGCHPAPFESSICFPVKASSLPFWSAGPSPLFCLTSLVHVFVCFFRILLKLDTMGQKLIDINKVDMRYLYLTCSLQPHIAAELADNR